ncbi:MAG: hypothetical protein D6797_04780 [Bdellovibrio sp.]|nr:MAG: hypothetical protein D6797_04780 [Bdellovibrio sp.]
MNTLKKLTFTFLLGGVMLSLSGCPKPKSNRQRVGVVAPGQRVGFGSGATNCNPAISPCASINPQSSYIGSFIGNSSQFNTQISLSLYKDPNGAISAAGLVFLFGQPLCTQITNPVPPAPGVYQVTQTLQPGQMDPTTGLITGLVLDAQNGANRMELVIQNLIPLAPTGGSFIACDGVDGFQEASISFTIRSTLVNGFAGVCEAKGYADMTQQVSCQ